jgi:hypothetical protein
LRMVSPWQSLIKKRNKQTGQTTREGMFWGRGKHKEVCVSISECLCLSGIKNNTESSSSLIYLL